jgi:hypothetical protein
MQGWRINMVSLEWISLYVWKFKSFNKLPLRTSTKYLHLFNLICLKIFL